MNMPSEHDEEGICEMDAHNDTRVHTDNDDTEPAIPVDVVPDRYNNDGNPVEMDSEHQSRIALPVAASTADPPISGNASAALKLITFSPSRKKFASRVSSQRKSAADVHNTYPYDCYSFIALNGPEKDKSWTQQRILSFLFGLLPFIFQMVLLVLLAFSQTNELRGTIGETDNPDQGEKGFMGLFATFIPANSTPTIRWAQAASLAAYVIFPSSSLQDIVRAVQLYPYSSEGPNTTLWLRLSCMLRAIQGITAMVVTLLLVLKSVTVVDIILNFTAVNFISGLDEDAFFLAVIGDFSPALKVEAERIAKTDLPLCRYKQDESRWKCYKWVAGVVYVFLIAVLAFIFVAQNSNSVWVTSILRVQFQEETGLNQYSGCFEMDKNSESIHFSRRTYNSFDTGPLSTSFGYCREDRQWILFDGHNISDPCNATVLARSSKTDTFDISTMFEESWVSASNTPLDLYFFDGTDETDMHCDLFLGDGNCDPVFNELGYDFDGGDCCAATCTKSNCGRGGLSSVFGNSAISGDGYESCKDPSLFPITLQLNRMSSSRAPEHTGWKHLSDTPRPWAWDYDENKFIEWRDAEPVKPYMSLDCNGKNVMTVYLDNSMVNKSQTVMVEDGAECTLVIRNTTTNFGIVDDDYYYVVRDTIFEDDPIWFVDYTIFYDMAFSGNNGYERVDILSGHSADVEAVEFTRIHECYFEKLQSYFDIEAMYTGDSTSNQAINWLLGDADPKLQCEDPNFLDRYALVKMNFAMNPTEPFINRDEQCRWPSINCNGGKVVSIQLQNQGLQGDVPSEIGLIPNVQTLKLGEQLKTSAQIANRESN